MVLSDTPNDWALNPSRVLIEAIVACEPAIEAPEDERLKRSNGLRREVLSAWPGLDKAQKLENATCNRVLEISEKFHFTPP